MNYLKHVSRQWRWALVLGWMLIIFIFSAQPAAISNNLSFGLLDSIFSFFKIDVYQNLSLLSELNFTIRKGAHFFIYLVLGGLIVNALWTYKLKSGHRVLISVIIGLGYAILDEFHQLFVVGRSGQLSDVLLDSLGVIAGIALFIIFMYQRQKRVNGNR